MGFSLDRSAKVFFEDCKIFWRQGGSGSINLTLKKISSLEIKVSLSDIPEGPIGPGFSLI